ncbi:hypothetical protein EDD99_5713 [Streptomyces sp. 846.5]|nr:hypothetical protein [Streptomyces sp. 846.5]TDT97563.1 hypothetical protein EDD99_5713 [Streptomyces sp. 846.5]
MTVAEIDTGTLDLLKRWITEFLARPHPQLGRTGQVCPFVEPASRAGTLLVVTRAGPDDTTPDGARDAALDGIVGEMERTFRTTSWANPNRNLHALVVALPRLPRRHWEGLDLAQARWKVRLAEAGLMLGQFHPDCRETAARNPEFLVSRSPVPMLALRSMAFHDVLFLDSEPQLFRAYSRRYGRRYEQSRSGIDPVFCRRFESARLKFEGAH